MSKSQMPDEMSIQNDSNFVASSRTFAEIAQSQQLLPAQSDSLLSTIISNSLQLLDMEVLDSSNLTASEHQIGKSSTINKDQQIPSYVCSSNQDHGNKRLTDQPISVGLPNIQSFAHNDSRGLNDRDCGKVEDEDISDVIYRVRSEVDEELCYTVVRAKEAADDKNEHEDRMQNDELMGVQDEMQTNVLGGVQDGTLNDGNYYLDSFVFLLFNNSHILALKGELELCVVVNIWWIEGSCIHFNCWCNVLNFRISFYPAN